MEPENSPPTVPTAGTVPDTFPVTTSSIGDTDGSTTATTAVLATSQFAVAMRAAVPAASPPFIMTSWSAFHRAAIPSASDLGTSTVVTDESLLPDAVT